MTKNFKNGLFGLLSELGHARSLDITPKLGVYPNHIRIQIS